MAISIGSKLGPYEITAPILSPLSPDSCEQLAAMGVHGVVNYPFLYGCPPNASLQQKQDYMADFAERFKLGSQATLAADE